MKTKQNLNELSGSSRKRSLLALSTILETLYVFGLDSVQKIKKIEKNIKDLLSLPGNCSLLGLSILLLVKTPDNFGVDAVEKTKKIE